MIADRHPLVVRQQRIVGPEQLADVGRVVDADVEVGVVADRARAGAWRSLPPGAASGSRPRACCARCRWRPGSRTAARAAPGAGRSERKQRVQRARRTPPLRRPRIAGEQPNSQCRAAGRGSCRRSRRRARRSVRPAGEDAERQVLDREVGVTVGRGHPALPLGSWVSSS